MKYLSIILLLSISCLAAVQSQVVIPSPTYNTCSNSNGAGAVSSLSCTLTSIGANHVIIVAGSVTHAQGNGVTDGSSLAKTTWAVSSGTNNDDFIVCLFAPSTIASDVITVNLLSSTTFNAMYVLERTDTTFTSCADALDSAGLGAGVGTGNGSSSGTITSSNATTTAFFDLLVSIGTGYSGLPGDISIGTGWTLVGTNTNLASKWGWIVEPMNDPYHGTWVLGTSRTWQVTHAEIKASHTPSTKAAVDISGDGSSACAKCIPRPSSYSLVFWIKPSAVPNSLRFSFPVIFNAEATQTWNLGFSWDHTTAADEASCFHEDSTNATIIATIAPVTTGWQHVACVWNGSSLKAYRNGALITTSTASNTLHTDVALPQFLGDWTDHNYFFFNQPLAELSFYAGVALTAREIASISSGIRSTLVRSRPVVYHTMWGTGVPANSEADLSGCFQNSSCGGNNAGVPMTGAYYACDHTSICSGSGTAFMSVASHPSVRPYSWGEEGSQ